MARYIKVNGERRLISSAAYRRWLWAEKREGEAELEKHQSRKILFEYLRDRMAAKSATIPNKGLILKKSLDLGSAAVQEEMIAFTVEQIRLTKIERLKLRAKVDANLKAAIVSELADQP